MIRPQATLTQLQRIMRPQPATALRPAQMLTLRKAPLAPGASGSSQAQNSKIDSKEVDYASLFAKDSTFMLMKKLFVYRLMGSNLFINHALKGMELSYKLMGVRLTNAIINSSVGSIFTSGDSVHTLRQDLTAIEKQNIQGIANYSVEGLKEMDEAKVENFFNVMMESISAVTEGRDEGHLAIKLTTLIPMDILTRLSRA